MPLEDGIEKAAWVALGGTLPATGIERAFALRHELEQTGTAAEAIVLGAKPGLYHKYTRRREGGKPFDTVEGILQAWHLTLRVQPQSEPEFEVDNHEFLSNNRDPWVGAIVPVIFDPADPTRIVLDERYEALAAAARRNEPNLPKDLPTWRVQEEWTLAHGAEMNERLAAIGNMAANPNAGAAAPGAAAPAPADPAAQLKQLAELHASGALTDDEFASARARVLDQI
jgi:hypothetical protein